MERRPSGGAPGLGARRVAARVLDGVLTQKHPFDDETLAGAGADRLEPRDRAFARLLVVTVLRRLGRIDAVLLQLLKRPPPARQAHAMTILRLGAAQLLFLGTPPHAAVGLAVDQVRGRGELRGLDGLVNAVLRRVAREGADILATLDGVKLDTPDWLWRRWEAAYGAETARAIAAASIEEPALDLSVKGDPAAWASRLGGVALSTGSVRLASRGRIEDLDGFADGAWWVQDAAAALPARMLGDVGGLTVADVCAAPGGKTAQLALAGADVTAVDLSPARLRRLKDNLTRLGVTATVVEANVDGWQPPALFDVVLLDAPCSATGTIRRHPDIARLKSDAEVLALAAQQSRLFDAAAKLVKCGGRLVFCTCSLEVEEGPQQVAAFLARNPGFERGKVEWARLGVTADMVDAAGDLRTLPFHMQLGAGASGGCDGFFAALLLRKPG